MGRVFTLGEGLAGRGSALSSLDGEGFGVGDSFGWFVFLLPRPEVFSFEFAPKSPVSLAGVTCDFGLVLAFALAEGLEADCA